MDFLNHVESWGPFGLVVLALLDSTSTGTLVIPLLLLMLPSGGRVKAVGRTLYFLAVIGIFYWVLGLCLLSGLLLFFQGFGGFLETTAATVGFAVLGALLLWYSFWVDPDAIRKRGGDPEAGAQQWAQRVQRAGNSPLMLTGLALVAGIIEAASMLPYLAAMGIIIRSDWGLGGNALALLGYCLIMVLPALLLAALRLAGGAWLDGVFDRIYRWGTKSAATTLAWVTGILGVVILINTVPRLFL